MSSFLYLMTGLVAESVTATPVPATVVSMAFFDKLYVSALSTQTEFSVMSAVSSIAQHIKSENGP